MNSSPETRESLLLRVRDHGDTDAWLEFEAIYRPMIYRLARRRGLQESDADDLAQRVLISVSRSLVDWEKDPSRGSFRGWLSRVVQNAIINMVTRAPKDVGLGGSDFLDLCQRVTGAESDVEQLIREIKGWLDSTDEPDSMGRFAGYEIVGIVGHGGMGIVLKGFERSLNRFVAIKVLAPRLATSANARQRFAREAQAAAAVIHENVIAIHRVDQSHGLPFLVMPYLGGESLQKRIDREGSLDLEACLRVASQVAAGLSAAHSRGLVHRDIKPANIMLQPGVERVTITDFGLV